MGMHQIDNCIFTGLPVQPIMDSIDCIDYIVDIKNKRHLIRLPWSAFNWEKDNEFFRKNKRIFKQLLINDNWFENEKEFIDIEKLKVLLKEKEFPRTPKQKLEKLFLELSKFPKQDGAKVNLLELKESLVDKIYLKSIDELHFYIGTLVQEKLIMTTSTQGKPFFEYYITYAGLEYKIKLEEEGELSNKCFIAMSFKEETKEIRTAIKEALLKTGFEPVIIDEKNIDSDKTINDEIIANLKKCKFCIADYTFHSNGVYFESGFALGQRKKVIYTCRADEFKNAHFDIRPLQHIIYKTSKQLEKDLINKIEAWIK